MGQENIRPKSIAREMFEGFRSFSDYVREYELQRSEGLLLRHLSSVYKVLCQTVPDLVKDDAVRVRTGLTDGQYTEVIGDELNEEMEVVAGTTSGTATAPAAANPFQGQQQRAPAGPPRGF